MNIIKRLQRLSKIKIFFLIANIFVFLLISNKELLIPIYIQKSSTIASILILGISIIPVILNRKFYFDLISLILFIRVFIYLIPLLYTNNFEGYLGNYVSVIVSFSAYFIASQKIYQNPKSLIKLINYLFLILLSTISLQVIYMFLALNKQFGELSINFFKLYLAIPLGSSNYIACMILPLLIYVFYSDIVKKFKISAIIISLFAILIIQSKNAIFILVIFFAFRFLKHFIIKIRNYITAENKNFIFVISIFVLTVLIYFIYLLFSYLLVKLNMGLVYNGDSIYKSLNALSSGRLDVYLDELNRWTMNIYLGNGLGYNVGQLKAHNWIIDLLVQSGVIGLTLFIIALYSWNKRIHSMLNVNYVLRSIYFSVIIILIQGLAEVSIFTISIDTILWFMIGFSISITNYEKKNYLNFSVLNESK